MVTLRRLLQHPEFSALLFLICTALFGWPFISIAGPSSPASLFGYLFVVWGVVIVLLAFLAAAHGDPRHDGNQAEHDT